VEHSLLLVFGLGDQVPALAGFGRAHLYKVCWGEGGLETHAVCLPPFAVLRLYYLEVRVFFIGLEDVRFDRALAFRPFDFLIPH